MDFLFGRCECRKEKKKMPQFNLRGAHIAVITTPCMSAFLDTEAVYARPFLSVRAFVPLFEEMFGRPVRLVSVGDDQEADKKITPTTTQNVATRSPGTSPSFPAVSPTTARWRGMRSPPSEAPSSESCAEKLIAVLNYAIIMARQSYLVVLDGSTLFRAFSGCWLEREKLDEAMREMASTRRGGIVEAVMQKKKEAPKPPQSEPMSADHFIHFIHEYFEVANIPTTHSLVLPVFGELVAALLPDDVKKASRQAVRAGHADPLMSPERQEAWASLLTWASMVAASEVYQPGAFFSQLTRNELTEAGRQLFGAEPNGFKNFATTVLHKLLGFDDHSVEAVYLTSRLPADACIIMGATDTITDAAVAIAQHLLSAMEQRAAQAAAINNNNKAKENDKDKAKANPDDASPAGEPSSATAEGDGGTNTAIEVSGEREGGEAEGGEAPNGDDTSNTENTTTPPEQKRPPSGPVHPLALPTAVASAPTPDTAAAIQHAFWTAKPEWASKDGGASVPLPIGVGEGPPKENLDVLLAELAAHWWDFKADQRAAYQSAGGVYRISSFAAKDGVPVYNAANRTAKQVGTLELNAKYRANINERYSPVISTVESFTNPRAGEVWFRLSPFMYADLIGTPEFKPHAKTSSWILACTKSECFIVPVEAGNVMKATWKGNQSVLYDGVATRVNTPVDVLRWFPWQDDMTDATVAIRYKDGDFDGGVQRSQMLVQLPKVDRAELVKLMARPIFEVDSFIEGLGEDDKRVVERPPGDGEIICGYMYQSFTSHPEEVARNVPKAWEAMGCVHVRTKRGPNYISMFGKTPQAERIDAIIFRILPSLTHIRFKWGLHPMPDPVLSKRFLEEMQALVH